MLKYLNHQQVINGEIGHDNEVTWLAMWKENISDSLKYVRFANNSSVKGQSDFKKFETARKLRDHVDSIRKDYTKMLKSEKCKIDKWPRLCILLMFCIESWW